MSRKIFERAKGQIIAEEFNRMLKGKGHPEVPIRKPDKPRIWITIFPIQTRKSDTKNQAKDSEVKD
jgi:hypothetical protein